MNKFKRFKHPGPYCRCHNGPKLGCREEREGKRSVIEVLMHLRTMFVIMMQLFIDNTFSQGIPQHLLFNVLISLPDSRSYFLNMNIFLIPDSVVLIF